MKKLKHLIKVLNSLLNKMKNNKKEFKEEEIGLDKDDMEGEEDDALPVENEYDNWVGKTVYVSSANFTGKIKSQRIVKRDYLTKNNNSDTMLLLYFENSDYVCNANVVKEVVNE